MRDARARGTRGGTAGKHVRGRPDARRVCGERAGHLGPVRAPPGKREKREGDGGARGNGPGPSRTGAFPGTRRGQGKRHGRVHRSIARRTGLGAGVERPRGVGERVRGRGGGGDDWESGRGAAARSAALPLVGSARPGARGDGALPYRARPVHGAQHVWRGGLKRGWGRGDCREVRGSEAGVRCRRRRDRTGGEDARGSRQRRRRGGEASAGGARRGGVGGVRSSLGRRRGRHGG
mmetsp:Transcript_4354/g.16348  ORF Transcript_4354/g.16348 Transcript_4354/m.16348 type:complete len:235 (+) Transcript_4354:1608-2312(+)